MKIRKILFGIALFATFSISAQIPTNGLVGYWPFNGNANDESGNGYNGTVNGATLTIDRFGNANAAYSFDGSTNSIIVDFMTTLNTGDFYGITISTWCKLNDLNEPHNVLSLLDDFPKGFVISYDYSTYRFYGVKQGNEGIQTLNQVDTSTWYNLIITLDKATNVFKVYLNNVFQGERTYDNFMPLVKKLYIGLHNSESWGLGWYMNGAIDDIRIYNRALNLTEVASLYNEGKCFETVYDTTYVTIFDTIPMNPNIPSNGLVAYFPFNGNANDLSGNNLNSTNAGAILTNDRFGSPDKAYSFSQTNIKVPDNALLDFANQFSLCAWFKNKNTSQLVQGIIGKPRYDGGSGYGIQFTNTGQETAFLNFGINSGSFPYGNNCNFTSDSLTSGWHFAVGTYDGEQIKLYVDGKLKDTQPTSVTLPNSNYPLFIGRECGGVDAPVPSGDTVRYFYGSIDDLRLYSRPLSQDEIKYLFIEGQPYEIFIDTTHITIVDTVKIYKEISVTDTLIINAVLTGIEPPLNQNTIKAYPNPTKDRITIDNGDYTKMAGYQLKIINSLGTVVFESEINAQMFDLDLNTFGGKGTYFLQLVDDSSQIIDIKKIILR
jgi:hypothetical protein